MNDRFTQEPRVQASVTIRLSEGEAAALVAIGYYGVDSFLRVFYKELGQTYLQPHEASVRSLFEAVRSELPQFLHNAKRARAAFSEPLNTPKVTP